MTKKQVPIVEPSSTLDTFKSWFRYSEVIFLARLGALGGTITTFVGGMDFSPFWNLFSTGTDFNSKQVFWIGVSVIGTAITVEMLRRRNMGE